MDVSITRCLTPIIITRCLFHSLLYKKQNPLRLLILFIIMIIIYIVIKMFYSVSTMLTMVNAAFFNDNVDVKRVVVNFY